MMFSKTSRREVFNLREKILVIFMTRQPELDVQLPRIDADRIGADAAARGRRDHIAAGDVEARSVPRADDLAAFDSTVAERASHVAASVVERVEEIIHVEQGDRFAIHKNGSARRSLNVRSVRGPYPTA